MLKKIISFLMVAILAFTLVACEGNSGDTNSKSAQSEQKKNTYQPDVNLEHKMFFSDYEINYPGEGTQKTTLYGKYVEASDYSVLIEAPSMLGDYVKAEDINDAPTVCEEYVTNTLEEKFNSMFTPDSTTQEIKNKEEVTYNGIDMLIVDGTFTNTADDKTYDFSAVYFLKGVSNNLPVYIVAVPTVDGCDVSVVIDKMAKEGIKKK